VTPASAGWSYVGFDLYELRPGEEAAAETGDREVCLVLIAGRASIIAGDKDFGVVGERLSPFNGKPHSIYVPGGGHWKVKAQGNLTLAICPAPGATRLVASRDSRAWHKRAACRQHPARMGTGRIGSSPLLGSPIRGL
jgi:5-deoxy-glucuronate isomerase